MMLNESKSSAQFNSSQMRERIGKGHPSKIKTWSNVAGLKSNTIPASGVRVKNTARTNEGNDLNYLSDKVSRNLLRRIAKRRDVLNVQRTTS